MVCERLIKCLQNLSHIFLLTFLQLPTHKTHKLKCSCQCIVFCQIFNLFKYCFVIICVEDSNNRNINVYEICINDTCTCFLVHKLNFLQMYFWILWTCITCSFLNWCVLPLLLNNLGFAIESFSLQSQKALHFLWSKTPNHLPFSYESRLVLKLHELI